MDGRCPCGLYAAYVRCCGRYHHGASAPDAQALMRSRYSAYVLLLADYLLDTWHPSTRPDTLSLQAPAEGGLAWLGLQVKAQRATGPDSAVVEFVARYRVGGGSAVRMREASRFLREEGRWLYLDADG